jgi:catechol 2,3-dioxygenase-like lactoylglutathione lyase family enzyme
LTVSVVKFHLSLNVTDLRRAIAFYRVLFDAEPAKCHGDYAKFEIEEPPVVFSLVPRAPGPGASLSHLGFRVSSAEQLRAAQERLAAAGICTQDQNGTVCGYAKQDKFWVTDPDGNFWEVYLIEEDVDPVTIRRSIDGKGNEWRAGGVSPPLEEETAGSRPPLAVWEHYVAEPVVKAIPHADDSLDEARLTGTFNAALDDATLARVAREVFRALKPGGRVVTHGLLGDRPLPGNQPKLPGLAALVSRVPALTEVIALLRSVGFVGVQAVKLTEKPWFVHDGVGLREVKLVGWKPAGASTAEMRKVLYKGPFAEAKADGGWAFPRGRRVEVPAAVWEQLRLGPGAEQFLFFEADAGSSCSCP